MRKRWASQVAGYRNQMAIGSHELTQLSAGLDGVCVWSFERAPAITEAVLQAGIYAAAGVLEDVVMDQDVLVIHQFGR
jgi:hypothetical protein